MKIVLIVIGYLLCLLIELPAFKNRNRRELIFFIIFMSAALMGSIITSLTYDKVSLASIIQKVLAPISNKIYGS
ncbi:hypothetical protein [Candidatus Clostridium radicumherbarum]|uniref:Uncharacterized protein n=1 Tax=Candidatus Clostridium radicumherbarum TaxID=3381662 RepID=A0ABW8TYL4_9CLOT